MGVTQGTPPASRPRGRTVTKPRRWRLSWAGDAPCQGTCPRAGSCQARKLLARAHPAQSPEKDAERDKPLIHRLLPGCFDSAREQHPQAVPRDQQPRFPAPGLARSRPTLPWAGLAAPPRWRERSKISARAPGGTGSLIWGFSASSFQSPGVCFLSYNPTTFNRGQNTQQLCPK